MGVEELKVEESTTCRSGLSAGRIRIIDVPSRHPGRIEHLKLSRHCEEAAPAEDEAILTIEANYVRSLQVRCFRRGVLQYALTE